MTITTPEPRTVKQDVDECWAVHAADAVHAETLAAEMADLESVEQVLDDMARLDRELAAERDAALLTRAKHPGNSVVYLN